MSTASFSLAGKKIIETFKIGFAVPKSQIWRRDFELNLLRLLNGGIPGQLVRKYVKNKELLTSRDGNKINVDIKAFNFQQVSGAMVVLAAGLIIALGTFLGEKLF